MRGFHRHVSVPPFPYRRCQLQKYCRAHAPATAYGTACTDTVFTETVTETATETDTGTDTGTATLCWKPGVSHVAYTVVMADAAALL